jgi:hypothetical protein
VPPPSGTTDVSSAKDSGSDDSRQGTPNEEIRGGTGETDLLSEKPSVGGGDQTTPKPPGGKDAGTAPSSPTTGSSNRFELGEVEKDGERLVLVRNGKTVTGEVYANFEDGSPKFLGHYTKGVKDGVHKVWYPGGPVKHQAEYSSGRRHGAQRHWSEDGNLLWQETWQNGVKVP